MNKTPQQSSKKSENQNVDNPKMKDLELNRVDPKGRQLTTNTAVKINDTDNSLRISARGPTLMEDFHFREKIMHFDHERIPERVVHAVVQAHTATFKFTSL
jgi:catalase